MTDNKDLKDWNGESDESDYYGEYYDRCDDF
jgi:hypothetical protein